MAIKLFSNINNYLRYSTDDNPTTNQQYQEFVRNMHTIVTDVVNAVGFWQPNTAYSVGQVIRSDLMPANTIAKVTTAGTTANEEPAWTTANTTLTDGTVKYIILAEAAEMATDEDAESGEDSTKPITSAVLKKMLAETYAKAKLDAHPVGSIYESTDSTSPATLFGGTWEEMEAGLVLVSQGTAKSGTVFTAGATGGEEKHQLTIGESPLHNHSRGTMNITGQLSTSVRGVFINSPNGAFASFENSATDWGEHGSQYLPRTVNFDASKGWTGSTSSVGGNGAHNNMQPYVAVYRWLRTA